MGHEWARGRWQADGAGQRSIRLDPKRLEARVPKPSPGIQEKLTFYRTLTAPLASMPPPKRNGGPEGVAPGKGPTGGSESDGQIKGWTIQVAAFGAREPATALRHSLATEGFDAYLSSVTREDGTILYRVRVGNYATRDAALQVSARLRRTRTLDPFVAPR